MRCADGAWRVDFVDALYGDLSESGSMEAAMQVAGERLGAGLGCVALHCKSSGETRLLDTYRFPENYFNDYAEFAAQDPWPIVQERSGASATDCILSHEWISDRELRAMEFYQEFWRHYGFMHTGGAYLPVDDMWSLMVSFPRFADDGRYRPEQYGDIQFTARHLRYAATLLDRVRRAEDRAALRQLALDRLHFAVMLITPEGEVLDANEAARGLVENGKLFRLRSRRVKGATAENQSCLSKALLGMSGVDPCPPQAVGFKEAASGHRWSGYLWPAEWEGRTLYFFILLDSTRKGLGTMKALGLLFGLSQAETVILTALVEGHSLEEIAESRRVSRETVRSQLKSLLAKTNCRRQGELVALAARMTPPVVEPA